MPSRMGIVAVLLSSMAAAEESATPAHLVLHTPLEISALGCDPSIPGTCGSPCDPLAGDNHCPAHSWYCYKAPVDDNGDPLDYYYNGTSSKLGGYCDCYRFNGCMGSVCGDTSDPVITWFVIVSIVQGSIGLRTITGGVRLVWGLVRAGEFSFGPITVCVICIICSNSFAMAFTIENQLRRSFQCDANGGTPGDGFTLAVLAAFVGFFAMFFIVALINMGLMWIDVYVKSKSMQKVESGNSLIDKYKLALRYFAIFFAVVFIGLYVVSASIAVAFTFPVILAFMATWPIGAFNLIRLLTGDTSSGGCCKLFVEYLRQAVPHGLTGKPCAARRNAILEIDSNSSSGKFMTARFTTANMVEKCSIRVWFAVMFYMIAAVIYIRTRGAEHENVNAGDIYASHFAVSVGMFVVILTGQLEMFKYCVFTNKGALDKFRRKTGKVGPGGESTSTFTTTTMDSEADSEDGSTRKLSTAADSRRKLSVSANEQLSSGM